MGSYRVGGLGWPAMLHLLVLLREGNGRLFFFLKVSGCWLHGDFLQFPFHIVCRERKGIRSF